MKPTLLITIGFLIFGLIKAEKPSVNVVAVHGHRFELNAIKRLDDGSLECNLTVTSHLKNSLLNLHRSSWRGETLLYDESGNEYVPESIGVNFKISTKNIVACRLRQNDPVKVTFHFRDFDPETSMISLFEIAFSSHNHSKFMPDEFMVRFQDIPVK